MARTAVQAVRAQVGSSGDLPDADRSPAPIAPPAAETEGAPAASGLLAVRSRVPMELYVGGRPLGTTDESHIVLASGHHHIELVSKRFNYRGEVAVDVRPGGVTSHTVSRPYGALRVDAPPGAEVWIEDSLAGTAPLGEIPVPIGTRAVVVTRADGTRSRQTVEVPYGEVTRVSFVGVP